MYISRHSLPAIFYYENSAIYDDKVQTIWWLIGVLQSILSSIFNIRGILLNPANNIIITFDKKKPPPRTNPPNRGMNVSGSLARGLSNSVFNLLSGQVQWLVNFSGCCALFLRHRNIWRTSSPNEMKLNAPPPQDHSTDYVIHAKLAPSPQPPHTVRVLVIICISLRRNTFWANKGCGGIHYKESPSSPPDARNRTESTCSYTR